MTHRTSPVRRVALETAWAWLDSQALAGSQEKAAVGTEIVGRVLACDVQSEADLPATAMSVVDGFAVRADDILGASDYNLIHLPLGFGVGEDTGQAVAVVSGRPIPAGFDTALPVDCVERSDEAIEVAAAVPRGNGVVRVGQAAAFGSLLLSAGTCLSPTDIMLLCEAHCAEVMLRRKPRVAVISFGAKGRADTSTAALIHLMARDGASASICPMAAGQLESCSEADLIVVVGRSGWGDDDVAESLIGKHGSLEHHGLALRPCGSVGFGRLAGVPLVLLPGDPLSAWVAYELLVARLLRRWSSRPSLLAYGSERRVLSRKITSPVGTADWVPLLYQADGKVTPVPIPAACPLSVLARAHAFALIPAASEGAGAGDSITIHPLKS